MYLLFIQGTEKLNILKELKKIATYFTLPTFLTFVIRNSHSLPTNLSIFLFYLKNYEILQLLDVVLDPNVSCFPSLFLIVSD